MRLVVALLLILITPIKMVWAQGGVAPKVEATLDNSETVPGQYLTLRLTVLVPTWLPQPIEFPTFEMPNLRVRLADRSTTPISSKIDGEQWSGVSRRYSLSPMVPGEFTIPPQDLIVTYADPATSAPIKVKVRTEQIKIKGVVPKGAEGLDPFIAAKSVTLTQSVSSPVTGLHPGDSVIRTVTAKIEGASPIAIPALIPETPIEGVRYYPDEPSVQEADEGGALSGTRVERVTLMAESGGKGHVPGVELRWFNLETGQVEVASVEGFDMSVEGAVRAGKNAERWSWRLIVAFVAGLGLLALLVAWAGPRLLDVLRKYQAARRDSKSYARKELLLAVGRQDFPGSMRHLDEWAAREPKTSVDEMSEVSAVLTQIGSSLYGATDRPAAQHLWERLDVAIRAIKSSTKVVAPPLPPLNPRTASH